MKTTFAALLALSTLSMVFASDLTKPVKKNEWATVHTKTAETLAGKTVPVLFLGDSITHGWTWSKNHSSPGGLEVWNEKFKDFSPVNFGTSGDKVENVLWRITEGKQLDGFQVKVVVVMIGVNNYGGSTPAEVAEGTKKLVDTIKEKQPEAKVLLLGVLPYDWDRANNTEKTNAQLQTFADGKTVFFYDFKDSFPRENGKIKYLRDGIHPTPEGYAVMADKLVPELQTLLK